MSGILSTIGSALGYGAPSTQDEISIQVGNTKIVGWETVSITRSAEAFPNSFTLTAADPFPDDATRATIFPTGPGETCQVFAGKDLLITGYVDRYGITIGGGRHDVTISGRGLCQDLADCSADLTSPDIVGGTISAANALELAQKLCNPYKITARSAVPDLGRLVNSFTVALDETPYEVIEKVARYAAYLVYEDQNASDGVGLHDAGQHRKRVLDPVDRSAVFALHGRLEHDRAVRPDQPAWEQPRRSR
jgi:prophage tail gpP-like protein